MVTGFETPPLSWTGDTVGSENAMFLDDAKAEFLSPLTGRGEIHSGVIILCRKDGFAGLDEGQHLFLQMIKEIIFDDGKVEVLDQVLDLIGRILDSDRQSALMGFVGQP